MGFKKGNKVGNRFSRDNQPKKNGRKPSMLNQIEALTGVTFNVELSEEDIYKVLRWALEQSVKTLKSLMYTDNGQINENTPAFLISIASAIISDIENGRITTVESLFDRLFGKAKQSIENRVNANISNTSDIDLSKLTEEQRNVLLEIGNGIINKME